MRAIAAVLLLACSARAENKKKPFHPPSLNPTAHADVTAPAEQKTSAATALDQGSGSGGSGNGGGAGDVKVPLTPYEWSGKAAVEKAERAPAPESKPARKAVRVSVHKCSQGRAAVMMTNGSHTCCPIGHWGNVADGRCWREQEWCANAADAPEQCVQATEQEIRRDVGETAASCSEGQTFLVQTRKCCPNSYWTDSPGEKGCYPTEAKCLPHSPRRVCILLSTR